MTKCGYCGVLIPYNPEKAWFFAADTQVCSRVCQTLRISEIENMDDSLENPSKWVTCIEKHIADGKHKSSMVCGYCSKPEVSQICPWCEQTTAIAYCSRDCRLRHWQTEHAEDCLRGRNICKRKASKQEQEEQETQILSSTQHSKTALTNYFKEMSDSFMDYIRWCT